MLALHFNFCCLNCCLWSFFPEYIILVNILEIAYKCRFLNYCSCIIKWIQFSVNEGNRCHQNLSRFHWEKMCRIFGHNIVLVYANYSPFTVCMDQQFINCMLMFVLQIVTRFWFKLGQSYRTNMFPLLVHTGLKGMEMEKN